MIGEYIEVVARGIPATARIDSLTIVPPFKGPAQLCDSDIDYYGYSDFEFTICDRNGREAPWLSDKMTSDDFVKVSEALAEEITKWDT